MITDIAFTLGVITIVVLAMLLGVAYVTLVWISRQLVSIAVNLIRTNENRLTVMEQAVQYTWRDTNQMKNQLERFFSVYGYVNPAYAQRTKQEEASTRPDIARPADIDV